jgi:hypothetical protein
VDLALCKFRSAELQDASFSQADYRISTQKNPDDVVITLSLRTPLTKARKGGFKDTELDYMVYALLKETLSRSKIDPALIEDVCLGNVCISFSEVCSGGTNHLTSI